MTTHRQPVGHYSTPVARDRFLKAVADHFPKVLDSLRLDVLPHFSNLFEIQQASRMELGAGQSGTTYGAPPDFLEGPPEYYVITRLSKEEIKDLIGDSAAFLLPHSWSREFAHAVDPNRIAVRDRLARWGRTGGLPRRITDIALNTMIWWLTRPSWPNRWHHNRHWGKTTKDAPPPLRVTRNGGLNLGVS